MPRTLPHPRQRQPDISRANMLLGSTPGRRPGKISRARSLISSSCSLDRMPRLELPAHQLFDVIRHAVRGVDQEHVHALQDIASGHSADTVAKKCCNRRNGRAELLGDASKAVAEAMERNAVERASLGDGSPRSAAFASAATRAAFLHSPPMHAVDFPCARPRQLC